MLDSIARKALHFVCAVLAGHLLLLHSASALSLRGFDGDDGTVYVVVDNQSTWQTAVLTQFSASNVGMHEESFATQSILFAIVGTPAATQYQIIGQSLINGTLVNDGFNSTGSGSLSFSDGTVFTLGDQSAFLGTETLNAPIPGEPGDHLVYGFNFNPALTPTSQLAVNAPPPSDGLTLLQGQSLVFIVNVPAGLGKNIGYAGFSFNESDQARVAQSGGFSWSARAPIPEPATALLFGPAALVALRRRARKSQAI